MIKYFLKTILISVLVFSLFKNPIAWAQTLVPSPTSTTQDDIQKKINELQDKVTNLHGQADSLKSQIQLMDNQMALTQLRITSTQQQINEVTMDIDTASKKVTSLDESVSDLTKTLLSRITATYEMGDAQPIQLLSNANTADDLFTRANYLRVVQIHDKRLLYDTVQAKNDYANQKSILEIQKKKVIALRAQLQDFTKQLNTQKQDKEQLLSVTKNSESEYQQQLADAKKELQQIQKAAVVLTSTKPVHVNRGDPIGLMGSTGHSTGAHLHFGVYTASSLSEYSYYSNYQNPSSILEAKGIDWQTGCSGDAQGTTTTGSGSFAWPMATDDLHITQGFGNTCYSGIYYGGQPHPAFDMYNNSDITVRATEAGDAYACRNCTGDGANGVFLFHSNGKMTLYWHLQ